MDPALQAVPRLPPPEQIRGPVHDCRPYLVRVEDVYEGAHGVHLWRADIEQETVAVFKPGQHEIEGPPIRPGDLLHFWTWREDGRPRSFGVVRPRRVLTESERAELRKLVSDLEINAMGGK